MNTLKSIYDWFSALNPDVRILCVVLAISLLLLKTNSRSVEQ